LSNVDVDVVVDVDKKRAWVVYDYVYDSVYVW